MKFCKVVVYIVPCIFDYSIYVMSSSRSVWRLDSPWHGLHLGLKTSDSYLSPSIKHSLTQLLYIGGLVSHDVHLMRYSSPGFLYRVQIWRSYQIWQVLDTPIFRESPQYSSSVKSNVVLVDHKSVNKEGSTKWQHQGFLNAPMLVLMETVFQGDQVRFYTCLWNTSKGDFKTSYLYCRQYGLFIVALMATSEGTDAYIMAVDFYFRLIVEYNVSSLMGL